MFTKNSEGMIELPKIIDNVRNDILKVAMDMFYKEELDDISMRKIATKSKVALGTLYNYFDSKEALLAEVFDSKAREQLERLKEAVSAKESIKEKSRQVFVLLKEDISQIDNIKFKNMISILNEYPVNKKEIFKEKCIDFRLSVIEYMKDELNLRNEIVARMFFGTLMWAAASGHIEFEEVWSELYRLV